MILVRLTQSWDPVQFLRGVRGDVVSSEPANLSSQAESNAVSVNIVTKHRPNNKDAKIKDLGNFWQYHLKYCEIVSNGYSIFTTIVFGLVPFLLRLLILRVGKKSQCSSSLYCRVHWKSVMGCKTLLWSSESWIKVKHLMVLTNSPMADPT